MFSKFELLLGWQYFRAKQQNSFIPFISLVSIIGIMLGVATLIAVLSVMNGFQREIRDKIIGVTSHIQITADNGLLNHWWQLSQLVAHNPHVINTAPYIDGQALVAFNGNVSGVMVRGVQSAQESLVDDITTKMVHGSFDTLVGSTFNIILGRQLAQQLGATLGDKITLVTPDGQSSPTGMMPRIKQFVLTGIFDSNLYEYDSSLVYIDINKARILYKIPAADVSGIRLKVDDVMQTQQIKRSLVLPPTVSAHDWIDQHHNYFAAVAMEKKMMFVVLVLIVAVAAFNLVSTLVMTVNDKKGNIAILRTMGASQANIMKIFILHGAAAGLIGTVGGTILGIILATYIGNILSFIEWFTHSQLISGDIYMINYLPSQIKAADVITVSSISLLLSILATIYPSRAAAKIRPAEVLRYE